MNVFVQVRAWLICLSTITLAPVDQKGCEYLYKCFSVAALIIFYIYTSLCHVVWCSNSLVFQPPVANFAKACFLPCSTLSLPSISFIKTSPFLLLSERRRICLANSFLVCSLEPLVWGMCLEETRRRHLLHSEPECHLSSLQHFFSP